MRGKQRAAREEGGSAIRTAWLRWTAEHGIKEPRITDVTSFFDDLRRGGYGVDPRLLETWHTVERVLRDAGHIPLRWS